MSALCSISLFSSLLFLFSSLTPWPSLQSRYTNSRAPERGNERRAKGERGRSVNCHQGARTSLQCVFSGTSTLLSTTFSWEKSILVNASSVWPANLPTCRQCFIDFSKFAEKENCSHADGVVVKGKTQAEQVEYAQAINLTILVYLPCLFYTVPLKCIQPKSSFSLVLQHKINQKSPQINEW